LDNTDSLSVIGLFVVVIWNGKGKYLRIKLLLAYSLIQTFLKNLEYVERNGILIIDADIPRFITATLILHRILRCFGEASKLRY